MQTQNAGIIGAGMAVPDRILTNAALAATVDTSDDWIVSRTGIRERRICSPEESCSTLGAVAARRALESACVAAQEVDLIICATATGDHLWPSTACLIQQKIGATRAAAFDLGAACSGFAYGLETGCGFIRSGGMKRVLVVGVDTLSKQVDWTDRSTCVLFGDGAGAAVLGPCGDGEGVLASCLGADGNGFDLIKLELGGTKNPITAESLADKGQYLMMRGAEVYRFAVRIMVEACETALCRAGLTFSDVDLFIPHQANLRIIEAASQRMGLPEEKVFTNVAKYGNTSAASIPMALTEAIAAGRVQRGSVLVFVGFGAGLTWGANVIRWSQDELSSPAAP